MGIDVNLKSVVSRFRDYLLVLQLLPPSMYLSIFNSTPYTE